MNAITFLKKTMRECGLSPEEAAGYIGCSGSQVRRWIDGKFEPTPVYVEAIRRGIEKMRKERAELDTGKAVWVPAAADAQAITEDETFNEEMKAEFFDLQKRATDAQRYLLAQNWTSYVEIVWLKRNLKEKK